MGIDISLESRTLETRAAAAPNRFAEFLDTLRPFAEGSAEHAKLCEAFALEDASTFGYLRSSYGEEGLFGRLDLAFGGDSMVLLFESGEGGARSFAVDEFLAKVSLLERAAATLRMGDAVPIADTIERLLRELRAEAPAGWIEGELKWRRAHSRSNRWMDLARKVAQRLRGQPVRVLDGALLHDVTTNLRRLRAFGMLAKSLEAEGERPLVSVSM